MKTLLIFLLLCLSNCFVIYSQEVISGKDAETTLTNNSDKQRLIPIKQFEMIRQNSDCVHDNVLRAIEFA